MQGRMAYAVSWPSRRLGLGEGLSRHQFPASAPDVRTCQIAIVETPDLKRGLGHLTAVEGMTSLLRQERGDGPR
jgi:hypothetical protein